MSNIVMLVMLLTEGTVKGEKSKLLNISALSYLMSYSFKQNEREHYEVSST